MKRDLLKGICDADKKEIVKRIIDLRKNELHLTQPQLAERLGYSQTYISLVESGERELSNEFLSAVLQTFNPARKWLFQGAGEPFSENETESGILISETLSALRGPCSLSNKDEAYLSWYLSLSPEDREKVILLKETALSLPQMR